MSYRPHPLRQSYTVDYASSNSINRNPSTTSSASSGYSYNSSGSDACDSTHSSTTSNGLINQAVRHKRGMSETALRHQPQPLRTSKHDEPKATPESMYSLARQSLRPLPQTPPTSGSPPSPTKVSPTKVSPRTSPRPELRERGKSIDVGKLSLYDGNTSPTSRSRPLPAAP